MGTIGGTCSGTPVMVSPATRSTQKLANSEAPTKATTGSNRETKLVAHVPGGRAAQCILRLSQIVGIAVEEINVKALP
jgi:hypothetical protein